MVSFNCVRLLVQFNYEFTCEGSSNLKQLPYLVLQKIVFMKSGPTYCKTSSAILATTLMNSKLPQKSCLSYYHKLNLFTKSTERLGH